MSTVPSTTSHAGARGSRVDAEEYPSVPVLIAAVALLGLAVGSLLNVEIYRVPAGTSLLTPASHCPSCGHPIRNPHNIPVLGWLVLRGRCADCSTRISPRYPLVVLSVGVLFVLAALCLSALHHLPAPAALEYFAAISVALAMIDLDTKRLPNSIVLPSYPVLAVLLSISASVEGDWWSLLRTAIGGLALYALYLVMGLIYPAGMGYGDIKLAGLVGGCLAYLSWGSLAVGALAAFLVGGVFSVSLLFLRRAGRKTQIPFGPFMLIGAWIGILAGTTLADWYTSRLGA